jgi:DNA-binding PadR family transcriptional regulator
MELEIEHFELLLKIDEECQKKSSFRIPPVGTPPQQLDAYQEEFQIAIELEKTGYIEWISSPHRESKTGRRLYDVCLVKGLTALGHRTLKDSKLRLQMDKRLREKVLLEFYESARNSGFSIAHFMLPEDLAIPLQLSSDQVETALSALKSQGWVQPETFDGDYSLTPAGKAAAERLIEGKAEISVLPSQPVFINYGQVGAMGTAPRMEGGNFQQWNQGKSVDAQVLAKELFLLREWLESHIDDPQRADDVDAVALAHNAARRGQVPQALKALSNVSQWLVDAATQVGTGLIVELLNQR